MRSFPPAALTLLVAATAPAGVYHPLEPTPFPVTAGAAAELPFGGRFDGQFPLLFSRWGNVANPLAADNPDRRQVLARLSAEATDPAAEAADLLRLGRTDEAVNRLRPLGRGRSPDFRVLANLAHAHAARGEWAEAINLHELAALEVGIPDDLEGTTPGQRGWLRTVEREHYRRWLVEHRRRSAGKADPADEGVFPLFAGDRPADAVAVVQQLLLWAPWDTSLYWLLAELYADAGKPRQAAVILDQCVDSRQQSNRKALLAKRAAVKAAAAALPPEADDALLGGEPARDPAAFLPDRRAVAVAAGGFALVAGVMGYLQVRRWLRRFGRRPGGQPTA